MRICNLGSGSKGNSTLVDAGEKKILIDAGLSYKDICDRLALLHICPQDICAIVISHEHSDHIKAVDTFCYKHNTKIYVHADGVSALRQKCKKMTNLNEVIFFDAPFFIGNVQITPIELSHDASCCHGYALVEGEKKCSILTDLGQTNDDIISKISGSCLLFIESNHDEALLKANPKYPLLLKQRILSKKGHLSNVSCANAILKVIESGVKQVVLSHLSEENNSPQLAYQTVCDILKEYGVIEGKHIRITVASQNKPSSIFMLK